MRGGRARRGVWRGCGEGEERVWRRCRTVSQGGNAGEGVERVRVGDERQSRGEVLVLVHKCYC